MKIQHEKEKRNYILLLNRYRFRLNYLKRKISTLTGEISNEAEKTKNEDKKQLFDTLLSAEITQKFAKTANRKDKRVITKLIDKEKFKKFKVATDLRKVHLRERFKKNARNNINIQKLVEKFYEDDINSRITPGKKQYKKKHGIVKQVRYLLDSIKNLHKKFLAENTNIKISYTTFTRLRPFSVSLPTDDRDTCACLLHTNFNLLIAALNKNNILHVKDSHNLIKEICCDKYRLDCLNRKCASCKNKTVPYKEFRNDKEIQYMVWERDTKKVDTKEIKIIKKKTKRSDPRNLIIELENMLPKFLSHTSNIVNQYATVKCLKESLTTNEALVHMDFSENYSYKYSEEVQSMHFGGSRGQVSLHTAVVIWAADSAYLEFRKQSCFECISVACKHGKHMRFFKIYNTPIGSTMENVKVIPENKRIKVLSDVTIRYANTDDPMLHDSTPSTSSLRSIRHSWANKCFINNYTKATDHEKEFLDF
ncbi:hypothetical protein HF086_007884 [Spodoptera exigua]|uniref:Uncharacterized protein n=1 Tax=Spodoptera exigua TaxID=7107 RepID=A0A922MY55_SPOEX|nr:hypothetical protein HF086_007884 [Spodoptera exigua]